MSEKLQLGENHRRAVSVLLRGLERMCDEIESALVETPGVLRRATDDLSAAQGMALRKMSGRVRGEIRRLNSEIELDPAVRSRQRTIRAILSANIFNLEESGSGRRRGYGPMSKETAAQLEGEFNRLTALLEEMEAVVEQK